ncbi:hypothetical protein BSQ39_05365 [Loigolactobacillus backii]|uniref:hypothetical protein n=1 Tax=Loigolactobacillus backii TaxID=375175 RepID=UPI000C1CA7D8|nr:hypothetical protein [Loigolactobacillus backii]PIO83042.1 hypothetical protein BSQ39_05365 [Loigolactobacillus backii]
MTKLPNLIDVTNLAQYYEQARFHQHNELGSNAMLVAELNPAVERAGELYYSVVVTVEGHLYFCPETAEKLVMGYFNQQCFHYGDSKRLARSTGQTRLVPYTMGRLVLVPLSREKTKELYWVVGQHFDNAQPVAAAVSDLVFTTGLQVRVGAKAQTIMRSMHKAARLRFNLRKGSEQLLRMTSDYQVTISYPAPNDGYFSRTMADFELEQPDWKAIKENLVDLKRVYKFLDDRDYKQLSKQMQIRERRYCGLS